MRIKGQNDRRSPQIVGQFLELLDQPRMSTMHAVKVADRQGAASQCDFIKMS
jgi:hypothetical protein